MIPRGKLYIGYSDICAGIYYCMAGSSGSKKSLITEKGGQQLICLSVRTGFDLLLQVLDFPAGSEILVTDINIPDMFNIITGHNLVPVPLPVNRHTLHLSPQQVELAITPATKGILITHLFGGIIETDELMNIAKKHGLMVFEDCAQAYAGSDYTGNPQADAQMFSFGFIKTNTAISGAMIQIKDPAVYAEVAARNKAYPQQENRQYFSKLCKVSFVKLLTHKTIYTLFYNLVMAMGKDFEDVLSGFTKGFPAGDVLKHIRYQPCTANQRLVVRRLRKFNPDSLNARKQLAHDILVNIPDRYRIGWLNKKHSYWVLPIEATEPDRLITCLRSKGFDASQKASSLIKLAYPGTSPHADDLTLENLVYLPVYPAMSKTDRIKLARLLTGF